MTKQEEIDRIFRIGKLYEYEVKPELLDYIDSLQVVNQEDLVVCYIRTIIEESHSYKNAVMMIDMMDDVLKQKTSDSQTVQLIRNKIESYKDKFIS